MDATYLIIAPPEEGEGLLSPVTLGDDTRRALVAPVPGEFRYRVRVPERPLLTFAIGIKNAPGATGDETLPGSRMSFSVRAGEKMADQIVFERSIHVSRREQWIEQEVDLRLFAGREVWLVFQTSFPGAETIDALPVVGVMGEPILHDRAHYLQGRGVVLISIDTLRRDHTSLYGYPRKTTPGLTALSQEAVVFDDAVSTSSWTLPAHASLLTSTTPSVHGAVNLHLSLSPSWPSLPRSLQDAGFTTQAFVTHVYLSREYGFGEGFDRNQYLEGTRAEEVTNRAIQFLTSRGDQDFFLFVHYYDPHWHYDPPPPYDATFDPSYGGNASGIWWDFKELDGETIAAVDRRHIEALYDGEILYTDRHVERLVRAMKRLRVFDKTLIVVTSDHGEEFLEHGDWEHQKTLYEEQLRVPLLIKYPNGKGGGLRVSHQVSLIDVAPTILNAMDLPAPSSFSGRVLLETGAERPEVWSETEHTIDGSHKLSLRIGAGSQKAIFSVRDDEVVVELYDLDEDPGELQAIQDDAMRTTFKQRLRSYFDDVEAARLGKGASPEVVLDPEQVERLRALGYVR